MAERPIPISSEGHRFPFLAMGLSCLLHGLVLSAALAAASGKSRPDEVTVSIMVTMEGKPVGLEAVVPKSDIQPPSSFSVSSVPAAPRTLPRQRLPHHNRQPVAASLPDFQKSLTAPLPSLRENAKTTGTADISPSLPSPSVAPEKSASGDIVASASDGGPTFQPAAYRLGHQETPIPTYPMSARRKGHEGTVTIRLSVNEDGIPESAEVLESSGDTALDAAAMDTLKRWRLQPARRLGHPITSSIDVPIRFVLN